jgi:hypothetical protein
MRYRKKADPAHILCMQIFPEMRPPDNQAVSCVLRTCMYNFKTVFLLLLISTSSADLEMHNTRKEKCMVLSTKYKDL